MRAVVLYRSFCLGALKGQSLSSAESAADFDLLWTTLRDRYAYFDSKATGWDCVRARYAPTAERAQSVRELIGSLEGVLDELYDPHTHLNSNLRNSNWWTCRRSTPFGRGPTLSSQR